MRMILTMPFAMALLGSSVAWAQASPLDLPQALQKTLKQSPALQTLPYQLRLTEAERIQAGLRPNPEVALSLENVAGTGTSQGINNAELTLSLSQLIEMGDKRAKRLDKNQWQSALVRQQFEINRLDTLANTTRSYIQLVELQQVALLLQQRIQREQQLLDIAKQRAAASSLSDADVTRLQLRLTRSQLDLLANQNAMTNGRHQLAAHWDEQPDFDQVQGNLNSLPLLPTLAELQDSLLRSPYLTQFVTQNRLQQSELQLAQAEQQLDIQLNAGIRRNEGLNDNALVFAVSMPWQLQDSSAGKRAMAQTHIELTSLQQQQQQSALRLLVQRIYLELEQLRHYSRVLQRELIPQSKQLQQQSAVGYQQGQVDLFNLLAAEQELQQAELDLISAQTRFHLQLLELERLTGQGLTLSGPVRLSAMEH